MTVLVLGGTSDARALVAALRESGHEVIESLAGATAAARAQAGEPGTRVGGFGGVAGLTGYLRAAGVRAVVNATHPFAAQMSAHAAAACAATGTPLVRLERPGWGAHPDAGRWLWVASAEEAAARAGEVAGAGCVLLTIGRQGLAPFIRLPRVVARMTEAPALAVPDGWEIVEARGPFAVADEVALLREREIGALVSKDSGGALTAAKLAAAREVGVPVVMIRRPAAEAGVPRVSDAREALDWVTGLGR